MARGKTRATGSVLVENMTDAECNRAMLVEDALPLLSASASSVDAAGTFDTDHVGELARRGLLGLVVPEAYGGLGGSLRDLAAATFAMGTACPSTAMAFFYHCTTASRGYLALEAIDRGLFDAREIPRVRAFAEKLLWLMGRDARWFANFGSEAVKSEAGTVTIETEARPVDGGFRISGTKSFGCATGVADHYLVMAKLAGSSSGEGVCSFLVDPRADGVSDRAQWDSLGMRGTATHGIVLDDVFVAQEDALAIPGAFARCMQVSRGSLVGNQLAASAVYLGAAHRICGIATDALREARFSDSGKPVGTAPMMLELVGEMMIDLETATLWLRRQLKLETIVPAPLSREIEVQRWRLCKGVVAEACFRVATAALKTAGTSGTANHGPYARALRDIAMSLIHALPAEHGRLEAARMLIDGRMQPLFTV